MNKVGNERPNMQLGFSKEVRTASEEVALLVRPFLLAALAALVAVLLASCGGQAAEGQGQKVPGAYGVDPRAVSTEGVQASDTALVVAPARGQAFQIPNSAFAYAKAAIDGEGYCSTTSADTGQVKGKVYQLTKNSESGREDERESNELEYFGYTYSVRASQPGVQLLESMNAAADDLRARHTGNDLVMCVVASGVTNGILKTSPELLTMEPQQVVSQLEQAHAIGDYSGIDVRFYGLGQSTGEQAIPSSYAARIQQLMQAVVQAGGGTSEVCTDRLVPLGCDDDLPQMDPVAFEADSIEVPQLEEGQSADVELDNTVLTFNGDSATFADAAQAHEVLASVAQRIEEGGYTVDIVGHTADTGSGSGEALSLQRAQAVADQLVALGVDEGKVRSVEGVGCKDSTSFANGVFDEAQAQQDRKVVLTVSR